MLNMQIHYPSVGLALGIFNIFSALVFYYIYWQKIRIKGLIIWVGASFVSAFFWIVFLIIRTNNWEVAMVVHRFMLLLVALLLLEGILQFRLFTLSKIRFVLYMVLPLTYLCFFLIFHGSQLSVILHNSLLLSIYGITAGVYLSQLTGRDLAVKIILGFMFALLSMVLLAKVVAMIRIYPNAIVPDNPVMIILFYTNIIWNMCWVFGVIITTFIHVWEKKEKSENELRHINELKDRIFQVISHDLKMPVTYLRSLQHIFEHGNIPKEHDQLVKLSSSIKNSIVCTELLMDNLFAMAGKYSDSILCKCELASMQDIMEKTKTMFLEISEMKQIEMHFNYDDDAVVWVDIDMILIVLRNLLSNSLKYTRPGGTITVSYTVDSTRVQVSVVDNGIGLSPEMIEHIETGNNLEIISHGTSGEKSSGFGLNVSRFFLEKHNSSLVIKSSVGKETMLYFTLERFKGSLDETNNECCDN
jgi:signal transduction histidine kinase